MERDFKGIWISKEIWLSKDLTLQEKVFYVEIDSLDNNNGCFANNEYFSKFFGISKTRTSEVINSLIKKGYIESASNTGLGNKRVLTTLLKKSLIPSSRKVEEGIKEKFKHNNIINNTVIKNNIKKEQLLEYKSNKTMQLLIKMFSELNIKQKIDNDFIIEVYDYCISKGKEYLVNDKGEFIPKELEKRLDKYYTYRFGKKTEIKNIKSSILNFLT